MEADHDVEVFEEEKACEGFEEAMAIKDFNVAKFKAESISKRELTKKRISEAGEIQWTLATLATYVFDGNHFFSLTTFRCFLTSERINVWVPMLNILKLTMAL